MIIKRKIEEARYFLNQVKRLENHPEEMMYNLDAFLASAKSITDYLGKQIDGDSNKWYKDISAKYPLIKYFQLKRNFVIHEGFINLNSVTEIKHTEYITVAPVSITIDFYKVDEDGNRIIEDKLSDKANLLTENANKNGGGIINKNIENQQTGISQHKNKSPETIAKSYYYFEDSPEQSVIELCNQYFQELVEINKIYGRE